MPDITKRKPRVLPEQHRLQLVELGRTIGFRKVASEIGVHAQTVATIAAGFPASPATVALVERWLVKED